MSKLTVSSVDSLSTVLQVIDNPTEATIITKTLLKTNKKDVETKSKPNPYGNVWKIQTKRVVLNPKYEQAVNEQRAFEDKSEDFVAKERKWGVPVGSGMLMKDGSFYLKMIVKSVETALYAFVQTDPNDVSHLVDYELLRPFVPGQSTPKSQGVDDTVAFITTKMENVLHISGETFEYV